MSAKDIHVAPVSAKDARRIVAKEHYSGTCVNNSQLHLGVFLGGRLLGAMQFGPSMDKRRMIGTVRGSAWNGFLELNRMAFSDLLPRNSESRALRIAFMLIRRNYPHVEWIVTFADGAQCGDGTIYRASGFHLIGIKRNTQMWAAKSGEVFSRISRTDNSSTKKQKEAMKVFSRMTVTKGKHIISGGSASMRKYKDEGFEPLKGFQLKYIFFLNKGAKDRLSVPIIPFSKIDTLGAGMYKGLSRPKKHELSDQDSVGGAVPTRTLQNHEVM